MIAVKAYRERKYYLSKYGEKLYIDSEDGNTAFQAAILTGKGLETEKELIYCAYGQTNDEAEAALENYFKANPPYYTYTTETTSFPT